MKGTIIDPSTKTIALANGWNWIGFISIRNQSLGQALGGLTPHAGDLIKSKTSFAIYDAGAGWIGSLNTLIPGAGYMYKSIGTNSFTYPVAGMFNTATGPDPGEEISSRTSPWKVEDAKYNANMTLLAGVKSACDKIYTENVSIGLMDKTGQLRALSAIDDEDRASVLYLTIAGDVHEMLDVYLLDDDQHHAIFTGQRVAFEPNVHQGELFDPYIISIPENVCDQLVNGTAIEILSSIDVYPSPFKEAFTLAYYCAEGTDQGHITITDVDGRIVFTQDVDVLRGMNEYQINVSRAQLGAGIYVVELRTPFEKVVSKIVKSH